MALRNTCIKHFKFKIIKISTDCHCQYVSYLYYRLLKTFKWANVACRLDIL